MSAVMKHTGAKERIEARVTQEIKATIQKAADLEGRSVSDFMTSAALEAAQESIEKIGIIRIQGRDAEAFAVALSNSGAMPPALKRARQHHKKLFGSD